MLVVDLPPEEGETLRAAARGAAISVIPLVAPTTDRARLEAIAAARPSGFVYYVSVTGITGQAATALVAASGEASRVRGALGLPVVVGFGIDGAAAAREAAGPRGGGADGIVVGTAIVKRIEQGRTPAERETAVRELVGELRRALDAPS
jgi:tryptophan synthase alpha chain